MLKEAKAKRNINSLPNNFLVTSREVQEYLHITQMDLWKLCHGDGAYLRIVRFGSEFKRERGVFLVYDVRALKSWIGMARKSLLLPIGRNNGKKWLRNNRDSWLEHYAEKRKKEPIENHLGNKMVSVFDLCEWFNCSFNALGRYREEIPHCDAKECVNGALTQRRWKASDVHEFVCGYGVQD